MSAPAPIAAATLPPVLDVPTMAALLGLSERGLYKAMKAPGFLFPELPRMGRWPRWSRDQVLAILAAVPLPVAARRRAFGA